MFIVREATVDDVLGVTQLERSCASAAHWTLRRYEKLLDGASADLQKLFLVAEAIEPGESAKRVGLLGFLVASSFDFQWELENIAVSPASQGKGVGKLLLMVLREHVAAKGGKSVYLEVRESNAPARTLYERLGFEQTGRRKFYYSNPQEDAVVYMWKASRRDNP